MMSNSCKTIMVQGTTSDAGKSMLVAALCRYFARKGLKVAPFKPQNMALNSAVTADGGEIGRAQAVQAQAANVPPSVDFNPVLLKPSSDKHAQVILHGKATLNMGATDYHRYKIEAWNAVKSSYDRLQSQYDVIVVEGAGSPAEINLRENDIANMGFAERVDCPVILIADIDRGGVFAHLVGTLALLSETEQARVEGFVINRFRGDISLLQPGIDWLEKYTGKPVLGVLPYLHDLWLEAEDALPAQRKNAASFRVVVPVFPRISNHTDFDALRAQPGVELIWVRTGQPVPPCDLIILPGSKNVRADLAWLYQNGWKEAILKHLRWGGKVIGICGGFQMLGNEIHDPLGIEGAPGSSEGLGLLDISTVLESSKQLKNRTGALAINGASISGYEIHAGISTGRGLDFPVVLSDEGNDGAVSQDNNVMGTYWHGLFDSVDACSTLLKWSGFETTAIDISRLRENSINRLADMLEANLNADWLAKWTQE